MGKNKHSKVKGFSNILDVAKILTIPKTLEKQISIVREKHGKTQTFQFYVFFKIFRVKQKSIHLTKYRKRDLPSTGTVWGKHRDFPYSSLPRRFRADRTHAIPNVWKGANSHKMKIFCTKPYHSQAVGEIRSYYETK